MEPTPKSKSSARAEHRPPDPAPTAPSAWRVWLPRLGALAIALVALWLCADLEIVAYPGHADDLWEIKKAKCWYWFDQDFTSETDVKGAKDFGPYGHMSFIKEPVCPLFIAVCSLLGLPLRLMLEAFYVGSAGFLAWSLVLRQSRPLVGLLLFAAAVFHPQHYFVFLNSTHDVIYPSLLMTTLGALILQFKLGDEPGRWARRLLSGVALGLLYNTRPEGIWVKAFVAVYLLAAAVRAWRRYGGWRKAVRPWLREWAPPVGVATLITLAIMTANYKRWGVFAVTDQDAPGYKAALRALAQIRPEHPLHHAWVERECLDQAFAVSPTFRELQPYLGGEAGHAWALDAEVIEHLPYGEMGDWIIWSLRAAAAETGHYTSSAESERFYRQIARELNAAAKAGQLPTRWVPVLFLDPEFYKHPGDLIPGWCMMWSLTFYVGEGDPAPDLPDSAEPKDVRLYNEVAHRRADTVRDRTVRSKVRAGIMKLYHFGVVPALAAGAVLTLVLLLLRRATPGLGAFLLAAGALGVVGFSRLALFTALYAWSFNSYEIRYLFPAMLTLGMLAVWLTADGLRLLIGTVARALPAAAEEAPAAGDGLPSAIPTRQRTLRVAATAGVLFLLLGGYFYTHREIFQPTGPDLTVAEGCLETLDEEGIGGWAWYKTRPDQPIQVEIFDGKTLLATVTADQPRDDLRQAGVGNGCHGFRLPVPSQLRDGKAHEVHAKTVGPREEMARELNQSPLAVAENQLRPAGREVSVPLAPVALHEATWEGTTAETKGDSSFLVFAADVARRVHGVRLTYVREGAEGPAAFRMKWRNSQANDFADEERGLAQELPAGAEERTVFLAVEDTVDQLRLYPDDKPCRFHIKELVLLVAAPVVAAADGVLEGQLDRLDSTTVAGWAWDASQPNDPVLVEVLEGDQVVATAPADQYRSDLAAAGKGNGCHQFASPIPAKLRDGHAHLLRVRVAGAMADLNGSPRELTFKSQ